MDEAEMHYYQLLCYLYPPRMLLYSPGCQVMIGNPFSAVLSTWRENACSVETGRNSADIVVKERAKSLLQSVLKQLCGLETSKTIMYMEKFVYLLAQVWQQRHDSYFNVPFPSIKASLDFIIYYFVSLRRSNRWIKDQQKVWN